MVYSGVFPPTTLFFPSLLARASRSGGLGGFWRMTPPLQFRVSVKPFVIDAIGIWQRHSRKANCITKGADWSMQLLCSVSVIFNSIREPTHIYIFDNIFIKVEDGSLWFVFVSIYTYIYLHIMYFQRNWWFYLSSGEGREPFGARVSIFPISHAETVGVTIRVYQAYDSDSYWDSMGHSSDILPFNDSASCPINDNASGESGDLLTTAPHVQSMISVSLELELHHVRNLEVSPGSSLWGFLLGSFSSKLMVRRLNMLYHWAPRIGVPVVASLWPLVINLGLRWKITSSQTE